MGHYSSHSTIWAIVVVTATSIELASLGNSNNCKHGQHSTSVELELSQMATVLAATLGAEQQLKSNRQQVSTNGTDWSIGKNVLQRQVRKP
jgi:hypothetical protein